MLSKKTKYGLKVTDLLGKTRAKEAYSNHWRLQCGEYFSEILETILLSLRNTGFLGSKIKVKAGGYI